MFSKILILLVAGLACQALSTPKIDSSIFRSLETKQSANILLSFTDSDIESITQQLKTRVFSSRDQKLNTYYTLLKEHADLVQANTLALLEKEKTRRSSLIVRQLWITNQVIVKNADFALLEKLLSLKDISSITEEQFIPVDQPKDIRVHEPKAPSAGEEWGILNVRAPEVWAQGFRGEGAVVAVLDTGVRWTHEALKDGYRSDYGWFDPASGTTIPNDQNGHGTHITGTIVGRANGIGVAPQAQWIACKGCQAVSCSSFDLLECGQWILCPTQDGREDCSKAPNAVSNGWGGASGQRWYDQVIDLWAIFDIVPFFNTGSTTETCGSINSPGDYGQAIAVAATDDKNNIAFGATGPNYNGEIKPNFAAPGVDVISAFNLADDSYASLSGSTAAPPHAAGVAALLASAINDASYLQLKNAIQQGAQPVPSNGNSCGGISDSVFPNNRAGYGRIDAVASLAVLKRQ